MSSGNSSPVAVIVFVLACIAAIVVVNVWKHNKKKKIELEEVELR